MNARNPTNQRSFIIVENDPIVGMDLVGVINTAHPAASVRLCQLGAEGKSFISAAPQPVCVLICTRLLTPDMLETLGHCVQSGGHVIFIGAAVGTDFGFKMVDRPFTSKMILDALPDQSDAG